MLWGGFDLGKLPYCLRLLHVILPGTNLPCLQPFIVLPTNLRPEREGAAGLRTCCWGRPV